MDTRADQFLQVLNHHRVALGGFAVALSLGIMTGGMLKPTDLLEEPMAAQLIASDAQAANAPAPMVVEAFPANTANRPWVAGSDYARLTETPLAASYDERAYERAYAPAADEPMPLPSSTPSAADRAVDAVAQEAFGAEPGA